MKFKAWHAGAFVLGALTLSLPLISAAQSPAGNGEALFNQRCKSCHDPAVERAPNRTVLAAMSPAQIITAMEGVMAPMAAGLSSTDKQAIAQFLTAPAPQAAAGGRGPAPARPTGVDKMCEGAAPPIALSGKDWTSVGYDSNSSRFQKNPGLTKADVPKLKLKWAYAMSGGGMPTVVGDWLFMTNRAGKFYALDAKTGCVRWALDGVASRTTPMVVKSPVSPSGWLTLVGAAQRVVRAYDAQTGKEIWRSESLESHPASGITGSPVIYGDQVFVPITSGEEATSGAGTYRCCSFRGSLVALDLKTGKTQWKTFTITEPMRDLEKNSAGTQQQGPAGGAIWSAPTVDGKRGLVYVATGDSYTEAPTKGADAIMAIEMKTGKVRWANQVTENDNFIMNCGGDKPSPNCPTPLGPDHDFGASPILFKLANGKEVVLSGQKSGDVHGMDPETGKTLWTTKVGGGGALGGIEWGMASDDKRLFAASSDLVALFDEARPEGAAALAGANSPKPRPGLTAVDPATGKVIWHVDAPKAPCHYAGDRSRDYVPGVCMRAQSASPSAMPGVVFSGTVDGWFRAYDAATGKILWAYSTTAKTYDTVNGVKGQPGGNIDGMGPAIANGMVYTMSGFNGASNTGGNGVNVLLAFSVDGK